jgi:phage FluMu protein gp41
MKLTISTGLRFAEWHPDEVTIKVFTVDVPDQELDPEAVWQAGNRITSTEADLAALKHEWQRQVRIALDANESPSLSVGDTLELCSDSGTYLGGWRCAPAGWTVLATDDEAAR